MIETKSQLLQSSVTKVHFPSHDTQSHTVFGTYYYSAEVWVAIKTLYYILFVCILFNAGKIITKKYNIDHNLVVTPSPGS